MSASTHDLQPVKTSLVADLVGLININLADLMKVQVRACFDCDGVGQVGDEDDGTLTTCATCNGLGAMESFVFDVARMKTVQFGRLIEGWDVKQGQIVPKMRSKTSAFNTLVKILGFDKAILEISNAAPFAESISDEQRALYVEQLKELAAAGLLDKRP
jgi:hypothetical protein